ncbi:hypothetical protein [Paenibacillus mendelii]|uniref:Copper amine oxidase-like N-terminal domain-containing protein n=1 Tax=Paenibacillus mendelii TaxID=206163 RepID=A0ABV6JFQ9_9BACL|nr:hypothetical protein [Paenibacillus mendelii]MCQ6557633.1 hypothetical protein [Paenibacillus mendelii]
MHGRFMKMGLFLIVLTIWSSGKANASPSPSAQEARLIVKASPDAAYESSLPLDVASWDKAVRKGAAREAHEYPNSDTYVTIQQTMYVVDASYDLYDPARSVSIRLEDSKRQRLRGYVQFLRGNHYGLRLSWPEAKTFLPLKSVFTIMDVQTGLRFQGQRRAGSTHADVQPLTKKDTDIMKRMYDGKWSWRRKAILVIKDGQAVAASMHGMPHGGDGIPDNGFSGHFCIHFPGSITHGSGQVDHDHQIMVHKAAGSLEHYLTQSSPSGIVELFFTSINQKDPEMMTAIFPHRAHEQLVDVKKEVSNITAIRRITEHEMEEPDDMLVHETAVRATVYRSGLRKEDCTIVFQLRRSAVWQPWKVESVVFR